MPKDLTGKRFGRIKVLSYSHTDRHRYWNCICDCGTKSIRATGHLETVRSCGCIRKEQMTKHGMSTTNIYYAYRKTISRCYNKNDRDYEYYGGRGIKVCKRWRESFENFYKDMGDRPSPKHTLDRIDNDGDYTPDNCRWATRSEQARNRRTNHLVEYKNRKVPLVQIAEMTGINRNKLEYQLNKGLSINEVINIYE